MRWGSSNTKQIDWHLWFAWRPVRAKIVGGETTVKVWLEYVERSGILGTPISHYKKNYLWKYRV